MLLVSYIKVNIVSSISMNVLQKITNCNKEKNNNDKMACISKCYIKCLEYVDKSKDRQISRNICDVFFQGPYEEPK